jgi:hypothetical protein
LKDSYWRQACANLRAAELMKRQRTLFETNPEPEPAQEQRQAAGQ